MKGGEREKKREIREEEREGREGGIEEVHYNIQMYVRQNQDNHNKEQKVYS